MNEDLCKSCGERMRFVGNLLSGGLKCEHCDKAETISITLEQAMLKEEEEEEEEEAILPPEDKTSAIENLEREKDTACASTFSALEAMHIKASSLSAAEIGRYADEMTAAGLKPGISAASCTAIVEGEFKGTLAEAKALKETGSSGAGRASD